LKRRNPKKRGVGDKVQFPQYRFVEQGKKKAIRKNLKKNHLPIPLLGRRPLKTLPSYRGKPRPGLDLFWKNSGSNK